MNAERVQQDMVPAIVKQRKEQGGFQLEDNRGVAVSQRRMIDALQRQSGDEEMMQGKFETVQCQEDDELLQGKFGTAQMQEDEEELMQGKFETVQCQEDDELLQGKFGTAQMQEDEEELMQGKFETVQCQEDDELLQGKFGTVQMQEEEDELMQGKFETVQCHPENQTGIPDDVKQRMENSFKTDFSSVRVHPESSQAPEVGALAYTQGTEIHFAPGQFKPETTAGQQLLGHELTHVIQQQEGRVQATTEVGGMPVNDDAALEREADVLGAKAVNS